MAECCICKFVPRVGRRIYGDYIGNPQVGIYDIFVKCTGIENISPDSIICGKCYTKLSRFYKAINIARQIKQELIKLFLMNKELNNTNKNVSNQDTYISSEEFENNTCLEDPNDAIEEIIVSSYTDDAKSLDEELVKKKDNSATDANKDVNYIESNSIKIDYKTENAEMEYYTEKILKAALSKIPTIKLKCSECDREFKNEKKLQAHFNKDHFTGYICEQCGKTLISKTGFLRHLENHDPTNAISCDICGQYFKNKYRLKHHMAWHSDDKPFQCEICPKRFVHRIALYKHKMIHDNGTRRIECKDCGFRFRTKAHLQRHMTTHTGVKPHSCPICGKCFAQRYNMTVHIQEHEKPGSTRQRRLKCKKCSRTFINKENYHEHCRINDCIADDP